MLTQNNLMDAVLTSACSSLATNSYTTALIKTETPQIKAESPSSQVDYDNESSDILLANGPVSSSPLSTSAIPPVSFSGNTSQSNVAGALNPHSPATPVAANGDSGLSVDSSFSSQALSASEAAAAIVSLTAAQQHGGGGPRRTTNNNTLFGAQMPVDINAVFGKFFGDMNLPPTSLASNERKNSVSPSSESQQLANGGLDTNAFLQLSHLLAAQQHQQQQQSAHNAARSPVQEQKFIRGGVSNSRHDSTSSTGGNDRRKSYPYTFQYCVLCQKNVHSSKLPCHIRQCHVGKPMFQCPACDFTSTYSKNNVKSHMVSLHGLAGDPINYMDQYAGQVEEFMKKCFPNVRGRGRPVHGRLSPSHHSVRGGSGGTQPIGTTLSADELIRRNSSPFAVTQLRLKSDMSDNEMNNNGTNRSHQSHNNGGHRATAHRQPHDANFGQLAAVAPQSVANGATGAGNAALLAQQTARFNEIYAMAMLGSKASLGEKFLLNNNNKNEYSLQNFNPLFYLQQLSQLNATSPNNMLERNNGKEEDEEKSFGDEFIQGGMEQILHNIHRTLEHGNAHNSGLHSLKGGVKRTAADNSRVSTPPLHVGQRLPSPSHCKSEAKRFKCDTVSCCDAEFAEPRYLPQSLKWTVIESARLENTVFRTFSNSSDMIAKLDLTPFEALLGTNNSLLTEAQARNIRDVRDKIGLKSFEIMFAVHRLDLQVLTPENVRLVLSIAPADVDIRRFAAYEQHNSVSALSDDEQFILQLSKIDRLKEKLLAMNFMGSFPERLAKLNQSISDVFTASKTLETSSEFHTILHLLLTCGNLISGDFNAQLVEGFRPSCILDMCAFTFGSQATGTPPKKTLLDVLAESIVKCFMHLSQFYEQCKIVDSASKVEMLSLSHQLQHFEEGVRLLESELLNSGPNQLLSNFVTHCESEISQTQESLRSAKQQLMEMLQFFGEMPSNNVDACVDGSNFFATISEFAKRLGNAIARVNAVDGSTSSSRISSPIAQNNSLIFV